MRKLAGVVVCGLLATGLAAQTHAHPDLNGVWRLNAAESDFGQVPPPTQQSEEITQAGEEVAISISIVRPETKQSYTMRFQVGGGETLMGGLFAANAPFRIVSVKGEWKGTVLLVTEKVQFQGADGRLEARYQLASEGKKLKKTTHVEMPGGSLDTTTVYDRE
jgi:hypothetical protein